MVFDGARAFGMTKRPVRQPLAGNRALPPRLRLIIYSVLEFASRHVIQSRKVKMRDMYWCSRHVRGRTAMPTPYVYRLAQLYFFREPQFERI